MTVIGSPRELESATKAASLQGEMRGVSVHLPEKLTLGLGNGTTAVGLFQGMFDGNILTFNPGWDSEGSNLDKFTDVRELKGQLKGQGVELATEGDESSSGPASVALMDPDGNAILLDQHI